MKPIGIVAALLFVCGAAMARADETPSKAEIVALIDKLVSPNATPRGERLPRSSKDYDEAGQRRVDDAFHALVKIGPPAFPHLHARLNDRRYCFTRDLGSDDFDLPVGEVCAIIIASQLQPIQFFPLGATKREDRGDPRGRRPPRPRYFYEQELNKPKTFETWWKAHEKKSLREIQIEVLEWMIQRERQENLKPKDHSGRPQGYSEREIQYLQAELEKLRKSDKPLPPRFPFFK
jgi:hypothetical protein